MNNKTLLVVFLVLLAIYGLSRVFRSQRDSNFRTELIKVDTAAITSIVIDPKGAEPEFTLKREANGWIASNGQLNLRATASAVNAVLGAVHLVRTKNIVAKAEEKWPDYEVTEEAGTRVRIYQDEKLLEDFFVGRFNFNPQARSGVSYLRLSSGKEVYAVDGFQTITLGQGFAAYRNRQLLQMDPGMEVTAFRYQTPDTVLSLTLDTAGWLLEGRSAELDSTSVAEYLDGLRNLSGEHFADDFDELKAPTLPAKILTIRGRNIDPPVEITGYIDSSRQERPFVFRSSQAPETFFASDSSGLYDRVFRKLEQLISE